MAPYLEPAAWHASLPGVVVAAAALIDDAHDRLLIVKPNYRDHWSLPGGVCEFRESPHDGCAREVAEELGLSLPVGRLLAVDWQYPMPQYGPTGRPAVFFLFDGGTLPVGAEVTLQEEELDDWRFAARDELAGYLPDLMLPRVRAALAAQPTGCPRYVPAPAPQS
ncbi:MAG TPA: NUDIX hydrolase [Streptosporangiaceae bacterium]